MSNHRQLIEPISILTNTILDFIQANDIDSNLINLKSERIYLLTLNHLALSIMNISNIEIKGLKPDSDNTKIYYRYVSNNINFLGQAVKKLALNLAEFLKTEDFEKIHPLYIELTQMGEKLIQETEILNSNQPFIVAYK